MNASLANIWAKSPAVEEKPGETLVEHTQRVVRALEGLMGLRPDLPVALGWDAFWHAAFWACCFHDLGKAASGFQKQLRPNGRVWGQRHEVLSLCFLGWIPIEDVVLMWVGAAIASHHRDERVIASKYPPGLDEEDDPLTILVQEMCVETIKALHVWLSNWANAEIERAGLARFGVRPLTFREPALGANGLYQMAGRALQRYRKLVGNLNRERGAAPDVQIGLRMRGVVVSADRLGSAHASRLAPVSLGGRERVLSVLDRPWEGLYDHQRMAAEAASDVILIAPTGSGKTEAAVLWAASEIRGGVPRLFYMLPYQASINAMHARLQGYAPRQVGLQHGRSLHALYRLLIEQDMEPRRAAAIARRERSLARLNHPPVRVLTPYQILKACFRLKGYEAILSDLEGAIFVIDEIHAYEAKRLAMILGMARYLTRNFGARWFVMSATLPSLVRAVVEDALGTPEVIWAKSDLFKAFQRHELHLVDGDLEAPQSLRRICDAALRGSVLVCCNTVRKAQRVRTALQTLVEEREADVLLLHGGFNARDRREKESLIMARVGLGAKRLQRPLILVATQVVEVSLNLSFDTIFTDPAPLDALVQRFGRVHRLPDGSLRPVRVFREPQDGQHVYDGQVVRRTMEVLELHDGDPINEALLASWLDQVYNGSIADVWLEAYNHQFADFERAVLNTLRPFGSDDSLEDEFYSAFDAVEGLPASLVGEYDAKSIENPIEAGELLVSVRKYALVKLRDAGRVENRTAERPLVLHAAYDRDLGLRIDDD